MSKETVWIPMTSKLIVTSIMLSTRTLININTVFDSYGVYPNMMNIQSYSDININFEKTIVEIIRLSVQYLVIANLITSINKDISSYFSKFLKGFLK